MKIHITSVDKVYGAWRYNEEMLRSIAKHGSHVLTDNMGEADIIFVGNVRENRDQFLLRQNREIGPHISRCIGLSEDDNVFPLLRGIYASAQRPRLFKSRVRSGTYMLYDKKYENPYVADGGAWRLPKEWLATFIGRSSHPCRSRLLSQSWTDPRIVVFDSSAFNLFAQKPVDRTAQQRFSALTTASKFVLCPRGNGASSLRLFECMKAGIAPVIFSDHWVYPKGPDWSSFSIRLPEASSSRRIEEALHRAEPHYAEMGMAARSAWEKWFRPEVYFDYLVSQAAEMLSGQAIPERVFWTLRNLFPYRQKIRRRVRTLRMTLQAARARVLGEWSAPRNPLYGRPQ